MSVSINLGTSVDPTEVRLGRYMMEAERRYLEAVLAITGNNKTAAAKLAGVSRSVLNQKLGRYDVVCKVELR